MGFVVWFVATTAATARQPDLPEGCDQAKQIARLEDAVLDRRVGEAQTLVSKLVEAFGCGPMAQPQTLARMWIAQAVLFDISGETQAANDALLAAGGLSPATWVDGYGLAMRVRQLRLMARERFDNRPTGQVEVEPVGYVTSIDGLRYDRFPATLPAGLHVVQVGPSVKEMQHAQLVDVVADSDTVIVTGLGVPRRSLTIEARRRRRLLTGLAFAGGAAATYGLSFATNAAFDRDPRRGVAVVNDTLVLASAGLLATSGAFFVRGGLTGRRAR